MQFKQTEDLREELDKEIEISSQWKQKYLELENSLKIQDTMSKTSQNQNKEKENIQKKSAPKKPEIQLNSIEEEIHDFAEETSPNIKDATPKIKEEEPETSKKEKNKEENMSIDNKKDDKKIIR